MNSLVAERREELEALCRQYDVKQLELFGSAATDNDLQPESDLDFLVEFRPALRGLYADAYFGLLESLQALYKRPVDLVVASAVQNPYFLQSVQQTRTLLYAA